MLGIYWKGTEMFSSFIPVEVASFNHDDNTHNPGHPSKILLKAFMKFRCYAQMIDLGRIYPITY